MISVVNVSDQFNEWAKGLQPTPESIKHYGFKLRVVVSVDIPPRHSIFEFMLGMGITKFDDIFSGKLESLPEKMFMAFPERHCSVKEIYGLLYEIIELNKKKNLGLKELDILTSSPAIVSDAMNGCLTTIKFPEGKVTYDQVIV